MELEKLLNKMKKDGYVWFYHLPRPKGRGLSHPRP